MLATCILSFLLVATGIILSSIELKLERRKRRERLRSRLRGKRRY